MGARAEFLRTQEELLAMEEADMEEEVMERRRREAEPVIVPVSSQSLYPGVQASLPAPGFYPLHSSYPVSSSYLPLYRTQPQYLESLTHLTAQAPIVRQHLYLPYPHLGVLPQVQSPVSASVQEGEAEPAALSL